MTAALKRRPARPPRRELHGVLLLDKPVGLTSNDALQKAKRFFNAKKAGHTGSLDPLASGLLPICFGEATKVSGFLLDADKYYVVTCRLGQRTATADAEGEVTETRPVPSLDERLIERALARFRGRHPAGAPHVFRAAPPGPAALRPGPGRHRSAPGSPTPDHPGINLTGYTADTLSLEVRCSKGTYIRTLAEDIAEAMGTCAHVTSSGAWP